MRSRRSSRGILVAAGLLLPLTAMATGPSVPEVQKRLPEIETARVRGEIDSVRAKLQAKTRHRPGDVLLRVYLAWCDMPSDAVWNALKEIAAPEAAVGAAGHGAAVFPRKRREPIFEIELGKKGR